MSTSSREAAPSVASAPSDANPHFAAIGGQRAITQLVERFYHHMENLRAAATIRAMHPPDLGPTKRVLERYLTEWMGGPPLYSVERGHPRLRRRHLHVSIGVAERDTWMLCMRAALAEVVCDAELRNQLDAAFYRTADFMRNDQAPRAP